MPYRLQRRKEPQRPTPRAVTIGVRVRTEEADAMKERAYSQGMLLAEWARGVLLRQLEDGK